MTAGSLLGQFRDSIRKFSKMFDSLLECEVAKGTKDMPVQPQKGVVSYYHGNPSLVIVLLLIS